LSYFQGGEIMGTEISVLKLLNLPLLSQGKNLEFKFFALLVRFDVVSFFEVS
jgi:hypothetical protein